MAQAWALILSGVVCAGLLAVATGNLLWGNVAAAAGFATNAFLVFSLFYTTFYLQSTYRTSGDFAKLALANVINNGVAVLLLVLVALFSFYGLCLRALLAAAIGMAVLYHWRPVRVGPRWNATHWLHLWKIGVPIFLVGQLFAYWTVLDQTLVWWYMGKRGLGLYAIVIVAGGAMELLPAALSQVLYPRVAEQFGRTDDLASALKLVVKPIVATAAGMLVLIPVAWVLAGPAVRILLPKYTDAVPAMHWCLVAAFLSTFWAIDHAFVLAKRQGLIAVAKRQGLLAAATAGGMAAYLIALYCLTRQGVELVAFPQAMCVGRTVYIGLCCLFLIYLLRRKQADVPA